MVGWNDVVGWNVLGGLGILPCKTERSILHGAGVSLYWKALLNEIFYLSISELNDVDLTSND